MKETEVVPPPAPSSWHPAARSLAIVGGEQGPAAQHGGAQPPGTRLVPQAFRVSYRLGQAPDDDVRFMARCAAVVPSDASVYGRYSGEVAQLQQRRDAARQAGGEAERPSLATAADGRLSRWAACSLRGQGRHAGTPGGLGAPWARLGLLGQIPNWLRRPLGPKIGPKTV